MSQDKIEKGKTYIIVCVSILTIFIVDILYNAWISKGARVFYVDDLSVVLSYIQDSNCFDFTFSKAANKIRPVSNFVIWLLLKVCGKNYEILDEFLLGLHCLAGCTMYGIAYKLLNKQQNIKRNILALICAIVFVSSRFAYYSISELLGIMECLGNVFAVLVLYFILRYIDNDSKGLIMATIMYGLAIYTHERYFILFLLFPLAVILKKGRKIVAKDCVTISGALFLFISFWIVRFCLFGNRLADGTGGTSVTETFSLHTALNYAVSQIGYIFGLNLGPQYLCGIEWNAVAFAVKFIVIISATISIVVMVLFLRKVIIERQKNLLCSFIIFIAYIGCLIVASSVTIRVEMRWIYSSYAGFLLLMVYMYSELINIKDIKRNIICGMLAIWTVFILIYEGYYRQYFTNIYYWGIKDFTRAIYETLASNYGDDLNDKEIIIIGKDKVFDDWTKEDWINFFKPYTELDNIDIQYTENIYQVDSMINGNSNQIVLLEDTENRIYTDITKYFNRIIPIYGMYDDAWVEPACSFQLVRCENKTIGLSLYYPENLKQIGEATGQIYVNGVLMKDFVVSSSNTYVDFTLPDEEICNVQIRQNYYVLDNTGRSEDGRMSGNGRLSCTLTINIGE